MINVTKTYLPDLEDYIDYLQVIWETNQVTNNGELVQKLEKELKEFLGAKHLFLVNNGTLALHIAIKGLGLSGNVITTPFSYVATTSAIVWEGCNPVYVDIDPESLCIDPRLIQKSITSETSAILATHVYGIPCNTEAIQKIASANNLKIIYDAAHAFGVTRNNTSITEYGDVSILSFHATKLFHTGEGGAIVTNNDDIAHTLEYMRRFGHKGEENFWGLGINAKMSELHAAMGLCMLPHVPDLIEKNKYVANLYDQHLKETNLTYPKIPSGTAFNYSYYPILFSSENELLIVRAALNAEDIYPRRYFYPTLNKLNYVRYSPTPIAEDLASKVLCLPLSYNLSKKDVSRICDIIQS